jgi:hypothetical protein
MIHDFDPRTRRAPAAVAPGEPRPAAASPAAPAAQRSTPAPRYAVQLELFAGPIDSASVPQLDLFDLYNLYSFRASIADQTLHALRLGFFTDEAMAATVARYLAAYFPSPRVVAVDAREQAHAVHQRLSASKDVGASGRNARIELTSEPTRRVAGEQDPGQKPPQRTAPQPSRAAPHPRPAPRSFWSRLLHSLF